MQSRIINLCFILFVLFKKSVITMIVDANVIKITEKMIQKTYFYE